MIQFCWALVLALGILSITIAFDQRTHNPLAGFLYGFVGGVCLERYTTRVLR